jgi:hypothetical protein
LTVLTEIADRILQSPLLQRALAGTTRFTDRLDHRLQNRLAWAVAVVLVLTLQSALVLTHWPWLDEWQALQIAVQSPSIEAMLHNLHYEGHPPLWYVILRYAEQVVPPLWTLQAVALPLAIATQLLILFASPFTRAERLYIATSQFVMFEMLTISRSFTLGTMLIVLALALWRRPRLVWLPIALLPMCDFFYGVASIILIALLWRRDRTLYWPGVALWVAISLAAAWTVRPAPDVVPALKSEFSLNPIGGIASHLGLLLLPFQWDNFHPTWNSRLPLLLMPFAWMGFVLFAFEQTRRDVWHRAIVFGLVTLMLAMSLTVYPVSFRHTVLIAVFLIALAWIDLLKGVAATTPGFKAWLLAASACGLFTAAVNFALPFDRAHIAAREIEKRGLQDERWLVLPLDAAQGIPALSGMLFENPSLDCRQSFVPWTSGFRPETEEEVIEYLEARIAREGQFYMITGFKLGFLPPEIATPIVVARGGYNRAEYELYLVGPNAPKKRHPMPLCVPGTLPLRALPPAATSH